MLLAIVGLLCLMAGLYAGKKRADGRSWCGIVSDMAVDAFKFLEVVWQKLSYPFRKGKPKSKDDGSSDPADE